MFSIVKKITKGVSKAIKKVAKGVKKVVEGTTNLAKKAWRNKYIRTALLITAAATIPGAIAAIPGISASLAAGTLASGALTGAIVGAGAGILSGDKPKEWLLKGGVGAATGAAFAKLNQVIQGTSDASIMAEATGTDVTPKSLKLSDGQTIDIDTDVTTTVGGDAYNIETGTGQFGTENIEAVTVRYDPNAAASSSTTSDISTSLVTPEIMTATGQDIDKAETKSKLGEQYKEEAKQFAQDALEGYAKRKVFGEESMTEPSGFIDTPASEIASQILPFQIAYQEANMDLRNIYNLDYGSGSNSNIPTELFRQQTLQVS
tara:strand:+ start:1765 stop:2718 length:954 start_codon:yes stop_codon:yes gene_type:complete